MKNEELTVKSANHLDNSPIEWLIQDWIPRRGITLLCSDGGIGKSFLWISVAAALSNGNRTILDSLEINREEKRILCFSGEDPECILRKRFEDANAKLENIFCFAQDTEAPEITFNSEKLKEAIEKVKPDLLIFDPLQAYIGSSVDMSRRNQMRNAMKPLLTISSGNNLPVLVVVHTNKRQTAETGRDKMADSADLWDIARSVIMLGYSDQNERYISLEKASYSNHMELESILFSLDSGRVNYCGRVQKKMKDFVQENRVSQHLERTPSKKQQCADQILCLLAGNNGAISGENLDRNLLEEGYSAKTIRSGKELLRDSKSIQFNRTSDGKVIYRSLISEP